MMALPARHVIDIGLESLLALKDNRLRTILSIFGITIGIAAVMTVGAVSKGGRYFIFSELQTFGLKSLWIYRDFREKDPHRAVRPGTGIKNSDFTVIRDAGCAAVRSLTPLVYNHHRGLLVRNGNRYAGVQLLGVGADYLRINNDTLRSGRGFRDDDIRHNHPFAVIGTEVARDLFGSAADPVGRDIRIGRRKFTVLGLLRAKNRDFLASIGSAGGQDANNRLLLRMIGNH